MTDFISMTGLQLLAEFNARAKHAGKPVLASFKISKPKLIDRINALPPVPASEPKPAPIADFIRLHNIHPPYGRAALRRAGFTAPYDITNPAVRAVITDLAAKQAER